MVYKFRWQTKGVSVDDKIDIMTGSDINHSNQHFSLVQIAAAFSDIEIYFLQYEDFSADYLYIQMEYNFLQNRL